MKAAFVVFAILVCGAFADDLYGQFMDWCMENNKVYNSVEEHVARFNAFKRNVATIRHLNRRSKTATFGLNKFADMSDEEFSARYLSQIPLHGSDFVANLNRFRYDHSVKYAESKNWVEEGAVTGVKNQGHCGSCWAFATTGVMEGAYFVAHRILPSLSEQQLVDCDRDCQKIGEKEYCDHGCNGGNPFIAIFYCVDTGMVSEEDYPYKAVDQACTVDTSKIKYHFTKGVLVFDDGSGKENSMIAALNKLGPLTVGVDATNWKNYMGGIFDGPFTKGTLNHGVLLVGYDNDYWLVKNSWGPEWGEKGYIKVIRGKNSCNIENSVIGIVAA